MRARLTARRDNRLVWITRVDGPAGDLRHAERVAAAKNMELDQPTFDGIQNGDYLTFDQLRILEGYKQLNRRKLVITQSLEIYYGKGFRKAGC